MKEKSAGEVVMTDNLAFRAESSRMLFGWALRDIEKSASHVSNSAGHVGSRDHA